MPDISWPRRRAAVALLKVLGQPVDFFLRPAPRRKLFQFSLFGAMEKRHARSLAGRAVYIKNMRGGDRSGEADSPVDDHDCRGGDRRIACPVVQLAVLDDRRAGGGFHRGGLRKGSKSDRARSFSAVCQAGERTTTRLGRRAVAEFVRIQVADA